MTVTHKIADLTGWALDLAVAIADEHRMPYVRADDCGKLHAMRDDGVGDHGRNPDVPFRPSTDWFDGGPIIERERVTLDTRAGGGWFATAAQKTVVAHGPTPLVAAMRAFLYDKRGETVELPA